MPQSTQASQPALQWVSTLTGSPVLLGSAICLDQLARRARRCGGRSRRPRRRSRRRARRRRRRAPRAAGCARRAHLLQRPAQVDGRRALLRRDGDGAVERLVGGILAQRQGDAIGGRGADQRRAAHLHGQDGARRVLQPSSATTVTKLVRQPRLVDDLDRPPSAPTQIVRCLAVDLHVVLGTRPPGSCAAS